MSELETDTCHWVMGRRGQVPKLISWKKRTKLCSGGNGSQALFPPGWLILSQRFLDPSWLERMWAPRRGLSNTDLYWIYGWLISSLPSRSTMVYYNIAECNCKNESDFDSSFLFLDWGGRWFLPKNMMTIFFFFLRPKAKWVNDWVWAWAETPRQVTSSDPQRLWNNNVYCIKV